MPNRRATNCPRTADERTRGADDAIFDVPAGPAPTAPHSGRSRIAADLRARGFRNHADHLAAGVHQTRTAMFREHLDIEPRPGLIDFVTSLFGAGRAAAPQLRNGPTATHADATPMKPRAAPCRSRRYVNYMLRMRR